MFVRCLVERAYLVCRVYRVGTVCVGHDAIYGPFLFTLLYMVIQSSAQQFVMFAVSL